MSRFKNYKKYQWFIEIGWWEWRLDNYYVIS